MQRHYITVGGGDKLVIDLGGYGLLIDLDPKKRYYDIEYIIIKYDERGIQIIHLPADMIVDSEDEQVEVEQADNVRIWRHEKG